MMKIHEDLNLVGVDTDAHVAHSTVSVQTGWMHWARTSTIFSGICTEPHCHVPTFHTAAMIEAVRYQHDALLNGSHRSCIGHERSGKENIVKGQNVTSTWPYLCRHQKTI